MGVTRRGTLRAGGALAASGVVGCGPKVVLDEAPLEPRELLGGIDHFVVLMMENRSFDHMLGSLLLDEGRTDIDGLTGDEWNEDLEGVRHYVHPIERVLADPAHDHDSIVLTWGQGRNDGFVRMHQAIGAGPRDEVMGYHTRASLPVTYALADEYTVCDAWFSSIMGGTWPNRLLLHCASANGTPHERLAPGLPSIFDRFDAAGLSSRYYYANIPYTATYGRTTNVFGVDQFFADAKAGTLPTFCMVDPMITQPGALGYDDHPPVDLAPGQRFIASVYEALARSRHWSRSLLILTYDEHGGLYDHVAPPEVVDDSPDPVLRRLGFRVPALLIGPTVRRGYTHSQLLEHVSVHATLNARFGFEPLTLRAEHASDVSGAIDPDLVHAPRDPIELPPV